MPHFKEALTSSGDFWIAALILVGFGCLLGCSAGAFVALAIIVIGLALSLIAPRILAPPR